MTNLESLLLKIHGNLTAKPAVKNLIVLECASDIKEIIRIRRESGMSRSEAEESALHTMGISKETAFDLSKVHSGRISNLFSAIPERQSQLLIVFISLLLPSLLWFIIHSNSILTDTGVFIYPLLSALVTAFFFFLKRATQLSGICLNKKPLLAVDLIVPLKLGTVCLIMAFLFTHFNIALIYLDRTSGMEAVVKAQFDWLISSSAILSVGILCALICGLMWFINSAWLMRNNSSSSEFEKRLKIILEDM